MINVSHSRIVLSEIEQIKDVEASFNSPTWLFWFLEFLVIKFLEFFLFSFFFFLKISFIYSWEKEREREAETQAEGEAGSMQEAWRGTWSWDSRIMLWAKGRHQTAEPRRRPCYYYYYYFFNFYLFMIVTEREREAETQAEGEAGSMQGPWRGTRSRVSKITPQDQRQG